MTTKFTHIDFQNLQKHTVSLYGYPYDSPIEKILGELLAKHITGSHVAIIPQVEISTSGGLFILDFLLIINGRKYAIECDGKEFHKYYHDLYRDGMLLCEGKINEMIRFRGTDLTRFPSACALFLGKWIPNLFDSFHMTALDMKARNERWDMSYLQDPEGKRFNDVIFDDDIMNIQGEKHFGNIDVEITCRNDRLKEYHDLRRAPDWQDAYFFAKENNIGNWALFVEKYPNRFDKARNRETHENNNPDVCDDDINIPF